MVGVTGLSRGARRALVVGGSDDHLGHHSTPPCSSLSRFIKSKKKRPHMRSFLFGRSDRTRTCGILLPKQTRYQLRHTPNDKYKILKMYNINIIYDEDVFVKKKMVFVEKITKKTFLKKIKKIFKKVLTFRRI